MTFGSKYPELADRSWLHEQYEIQGKSTQQIATQLGTGSGNVCWWLRKHGIEPRDRHSGKLNPKICERCGKEYTPSGRAQRFCSLECRPDARACQQCGKLFQAPPPRKTTDAQSKRKFCSWECLTAWRGENCTHRYLNNDGYVIIKVPPTAHRDVNNKGYARVNLGTGRHGGGRVLEHRWVMEQMLGRPLLPTEDVHHKNAVRTDNTPGNLELWDTSQPRGGRVEDKIEWALEFLAHYGEVRFTRK